MSEQQEQQVVDALADAVISQIDSGMVVGLGTGSTAKRAIRALADRVRIEGLDIRCAPTSEGSEQLARELGLDIIEFALVEQIDFLFDGANEVDHQMRMLKGSGGAMTRERMVAWASKRRVYMVNHNKVVEKLGTNAALPVAVMAFGLASIRAELRAFGFNGVCRRNLDGSLFITDNGNLIIDVSIDGEIDLATLVEELNSIPGVIDHGLFLSEADEILVDGPDGIHHMIRAPE